MGVHDGLRRRTYKITTCALTFQKALEGMLRLQEESESKGWNGSAPLRDSGNTTKWEMEEELLPWPKFEEQA